MTISKEIFGIERKEPYTRAISGPGIDNSQFNACLDIIDQFHFSEEELFNIIDKTFNLVSEDSFTNFNYLASSKNRNKAIAKAIIQNKSKIFVRKTK